MRSSTATRSYPTWRPERGGFYWHDGLDAGRDGATRPWFLPAGRAEVVGGPRRVGRSCARPDLHDPDLARKDAAPAVFGAAIGRSLVGSVLPGCVCWSRPMYRRPVLAVASGFCVLANLLPVWGAVDHVHVAPMSDAAISIYVSNMRLENQTPEAQIQQAMASGADVLVLLEFGQGYLNAVPGRRDRRLVSEPGPASGGRGGHRHLLATSVAPQRHGRRR